MSWTPPETLPGTPKGDNNQPVLPAALSRLDQQQRDIPLASYGNAYADQDDDIDLNAQDDGPDFPGSIDAMSDIWAQWVPQDHTAGSMANTNHAWQLNLDSGPEAYPPTSLRFPESFPRGPDWIPTASSDTPSYDDTGEEGMGGANNVAENGASGGSNRRRASTVNNKSDVQLRVTHLSELSSSLSQLLGSSKFFFAEALDTSRQSRTHEPARQVQFGIEAVFKSVNTWLVQGSGNTNPCSRLDLASTNAFDLPHKVFSASNHLLGILRGSSRYAETIAAKLPGDPSLHCYSIFYHLVHVCATLLLHIYVAILVALKRCADALNSSPRTHAGDPAQPNDDMDATSRGHLQLVSVTQLCSYFIKRQNQALDLISSSSQGSSLGDHLHRQSTSFETLNALRTEVNQGLRRLQESLLCTPWA